MTQAVHPKLIRWARDFQFTGETLRDVPAFLEHHGFPHVATHLKAVALEARNLAERFGLNANAALEHGLDAGTRFFLEHLISSPNLLVIHPWLRDAHAEFHA